MKFYGYNEVKKVRDDLSDLVKLINIKGNPEIINIANAMEPHIKYYNNLMNSLGILGVVKDKDVIKALEITERDIREIKKLL